LEAVLTASKLCDADLDGAKLGSRELWFKPKEVKGGCFEAEIGTAGSISMLLMTVLPICLFAKETVQLRVSKGGTDVSNAPTINYMRNVFLPMLRRMGVNASITVHRYGYYPKGMGEVTLTVEPCKELQPICLESLGEITAIKGVSVCTFLAQKRVAERQAKAAKDYLRKAGYEADIQIINDMSNPLQKGSSLVLWAETSTGAIIGADAIGELKKTSEAVGVEAAEKLYEDLRVKATVDVHMSDMLIPYMALAKGSSVYLVRKVSDHLETNIWLAEKLLGVKFSIKGIVGGLYRVEKTG
jgi:RNA 3'-terminal phosphate cyclase (ATP)